MDFHTLKRKDLQALCKKNKIPANMTNAAMADALASLEIIEGLEDFFGHSEAEAPEYPERSVVTSPNAFQTATRRTTPKEELECSNLATRTLCGTRRRAVEGTDGRKKDVSQTPATRTTQRSSRQEASVQQKMEKIFQTEFDGGLEEPEVSEKDGLPGCESREISEEASGISMEHEGHRLSDIQNEPQVNLQEVKDVGEEIIVAENNKENLGEEHDVSEATEESVEKFSGSQRVNFQNLSRKDLQNLCKKNKIPANMTNAAMASALESLESVEGLEEFLKDWDSEAPKSPEISEVTSSCVRRTCTSRKTIKELESFKLMTQSSLRTRQSGVKEVEGTNDVTKTTAEPGTRRRAARADSTISKVETVEKKEESVVSTYNQKSSTRNLLKEMGDSSTEDTQYSISINTDEGGLSMEVEQDLQSHLEADLEKSEVLDCSSADNGDESSKAMPQEVSDEAATSVVELEYRKKLQDNEDENKFDMRENKSVDTEVSDFHGELVANSNNFIESTTDNELKPIADHCPVNCLGQKQSYLLENDDDQFPENALDNKGHEQANLADGQETKGNDSDEKSNAFDEPNFDEGLMQESPEAETKEFDESSDNIFSNLSEDKCILKDDSEKGNAENLKQQATDEMDVNVVENTSAECPDSAEVFSNMVNVDMSPKPVFNRAAQDENLKQQATKAMDVNVVEITSVEYSDSAEVFSNVVNVEMSPKPVFNCALQDEDPKIGSSSVPKFSNVIEELSSLEINVDANSENFHQELDKSLSSISDAAAHLCPLEKHEDSHAEDQISIQFESGSTTQVDENEPEGKEKPLCHLSLRKLKRMLKEQLRAKTLAKKMEKLTLAESESLLDPGLTTEVEEDLQKGFEEVQGVCGVDHAPVSDVIYRDTAIDKDDEESRDDVLDITEFDDDGEAERNCASQMKATTTLEDEALSSVSILMDNELISEDSVTGHIDVEYVGSGSSNVNLQKSLDVSASEEPDKQTTGEKSDNITHLLQITPNKSSSKTLRPQHFTPSKSAGRMSQVLDANKENIDSSASKTEPRKMTMAVVGGGELLSTMSMGKLKKEFKVLQQQSEKKRTALRSRSENHCSLASP